MEVINSIIKVLLIGNYNSEVQFVKHSLTKIKSRKIEVIKSQTIRNSLSYLDKDKVDIVIVNYNSDNDKDLNTLKNIKTFNKNNVPALIVLEQSDPLLISLISEVEDYLIREEISVTLLEKSISYILKKQKNIQDNLELKSQLENSKQLFQSIIDKTSTLVWVTDAQGNYSFANRAWLKFLGQTSEAKLNRDWMNNIHPEELDEFQEKFKSAIIKTKGFSLDYRLKRFDHKYRWLSHCAVPNFSPEGKFEGLVCYGFDITKHKKIESQLIQRAESDRLLAEITRKIHASLDLDIILQTTVREINHFLQAEKVQINKVNAAGKLTLLFESALTEEILSCDISEAEKVSTPMFQEHIKHLSQGKTLIKEPTTIPQTLTEETKLAELNACSILLVPIFSGQDLWGSLCAKQCATSRQWKSTENQLLERVALELSVAIKQAELYQKLEQANQELEQLSLIDSLTQIANRRKFDQYLAAEWKRLAREQNPLSLIFCDLDHFKVYNDTYGHQAGDRCLQVVAQAINRVIKRPADLLTRYGGEEFAIILPNTDGEGAKYLAKQILLQVEALSIPNINSPVDLYVTLSLGVVSCIPNRNSDFDNLVAAADRGLYQAKKLGRNQFVEWEIEPEEFNFA